MIKTKPLRKYDIVVPVNGHALRSGAQWYPNAVVMSVEPFVLVSQEGDMRWSATVETKNFVSVGRASWLTRWRIRPRKHQ